MVNAPVTDALEAERAMWLLHIRDAARPAAAALIALDDMLSRTVHTGREAMLRRIKLAWWRDALAALDTAPPPAEPVLTALGDAMLPSGTTGADLAAITDGWEELLDDRIDAAALARFAATAGGGLFRALATALGDDDDRVPDAGAGWALAQLALQTRQADVRTLAIPLAARRLDHLSATRWPRRLRPIGMLAGLARLDLAGIAPNTPARAALLLRIRLLGR